jgi:type I restriction enzyme S subunit
LFFTSSGETAEEIGKCVSYQGDEDIYIGGDIIALTPNSNYNSLYLAFAQNSMPVIKQKSVLGQGHTVVHIYTEHIKSLVMPIPPLPEQQAIATALSDIDGLISSLTKLIDKKKNIKQGAMQELLTGKKRIDGFSGDWVEKELGDIGNIATGNTPPTIDISNYGNEYLFVSPADLGMSKYVQNTDKKLSEKGFGISRKFPKGSILFTCIGSTIGKSSIAPVDVTSNQQINAIFPNSNYSTDFIYYMLNYLVTEIKSLASEQAVPIINKSNFEKIQILLPNILEQTAIAQIIADMDSEIEKLTQKSTKYKHIKQGMMQELLTGKRRLI